MAPSASGSDPVSSATSRLAHLPGHFQRLADDSPQQRQVERLEKAVIGALPHGLDGRVGSLRPDEKNDRDVRVDAANLLVDLQTRLVGQAQSGQ